MQQAAIKKAENEASNEPGMHEWIKLAVKQRIVKILMTILHPAQGANWNKL